MPTDRRHLLTGALALAAATPCAAVAVRAQSSYPSRPVRVIVTFAPGGQTDVAARLVCGTMSAATGRQFFVENIVGGAGNVAMGQAARATPDGYTMLAAFSNFVINPSLFAHIPYDPVRDFEPVSLAVTSTLVFVVNPEMPVKTIAELVALMRANPGKFSYASAGAGTSGHLAGEQFRLAVEPDLIHVPFGGGAPAMASVVAGHTPIGVGAPTAVSALIADGKLRPLAVTARARTAVLPDVPTLAESGYPDIEGDSFVGFVVPAATPKDVVALLNREIVASLSTADMKARQAALGNDIVASTPEAFADRIRRELALWSRVIRAAGIRAG